MFFHDLLPPFLFLLPLFNEIIVPDFPDKKILSYVIEI